MSGRGWVNNRTLLAVILLMLAIFIYLIPALRFNVYSLACGLSEKEYHHTYLVVLIVQGAQKNSYKTKNLIIYTKQWAGGFCIT